MEAQKILSLVNVSKQFGNKHVLNGVNLEVYEGQIIGYIGPNGTTWLVPQLIKKI